MTISEWIAERRRIAEKATGPSELSGLWAQCSFDSAKVEWRGCCNRHGEIVTSAHPNYCATIVDAHNALPLALQALERAVEALNAAERFGAEGLNGLVRGFIGNAEHDFREQQAEIRSGVADIQKILEGNTSE